MKENTLETLARWVYNPFAYESHRGGFSNDDIFVYCTCLGAALRLSDEENIEPLRVFLEEEGNSYYSAEVSVLVGMLGDEDLRDVLQRVKEFRNERTRKSVKPTEDVTTLFLKINKQSRGSPI